MRRGLGVVASRAESLSRFMEAYGRLARLPAPQFQRVDVETLVRRVAGLEPRVPVSVRTGPPVALEADPVQLEQLLINLLRNAADAGLETGGAPVEITWEVTDAGRLEVRVEDRGPGLPETANLFVPFFTTKAGGSGIGLVLSRQIAEAHGGSLLVENREGGGCRARLTLPRSLEVARAAGEPHA
jgi:signal transduction histidine kinase